MPLQDLPQELLLGIASRLDKPWHLQNLCLASRSLHAQLNVFLHRNFPSYSLLWASMHNDLETAEKALPPVDWADTLVEHLGSEIMRIAASCGYDKMMQLFIDHGLDPAAVQRERSISHVDQGDSEEVQLRKIEVVRLFIRDNKDMTPDGRVVAAKPPIEIALEKGHHNILKMLLEHGANVGGMAGYSLLKIAAAAERCEVDLVKLLIEYGARPSMALDHHHHHHQHPREWRETPLHVAVTFKRADAVKLFLETGVDAEDVGLGQGSLFYAAKFGSTEILRLLLAGRSGGIQEADAVLLFHAAKEGHLGTVRLLLDAGVRADCWIADHVPLESLFDTSALSAAAGQGHEDILRLLIDKWPPSARDSNGQSRIALIEAIIKGHNAILRALLEWDVDANGTISAMGTPFLLFGSSYAPPETVKVLLESGADPNVRDVEGRSSIGAAIGYARVDIVKLLLDYGAKLDPSRFEKDSEAIDGLTGDKAHDKKEVQELLDLLSVTSS